MKYEVRCECGKAHPVTAADAGSSLRCGCGRAVEVPPLHQLRASAGQAALSPVVEVRSLLLRGQLPATRDCACCHRETDGLLRVSVECERPIVKNSTSKAEWLAGCLLFGWLGALVMFRSREPIVHGEEVVLTVPVRVCDACRDTLADPGILRQALRQTPVYAALLDRYPNARITHRA